MISFLLRLYKVVISPFTHLIGSQIIGNSFSCRFTPTCSEYSSQAIKKHGIIHGVRLSIIRILRCNPYSKGGLDPIPDKI